MATARIQHETGLIKLRVSLNEFRVFEYNAVAGRGMRILISAYAPGTNPIS